MLGVGMLVIDGNNLMHQPMPQSLAGLDEAMLSRLLAHAAWTPAVLMLDGRAGGDRPRRSGYRGVSLRYAGAGRTADELIIDLVERSTTPRRMEIVTNDRAIQKAVRRRRAKVWNCQAFISELLARLAGGPGEPAEPDDVFDDDVGPAAGSRTRTLEADDVEDWLETFGFSDEDRKPGS